MRQIGVQKIFWDAFEFAMSTQTKRLVRDIADSLGKDAAPLLSEIKKESVGVYLYEDSATDNIDLFDMKCCNTATIGVWKTACSEPVVWSSNPIARTGACLYHSLHPEPRDPSWKKCLRWKYEDKDYYIDVDEGLVYNVEGVLCGRYSAENKKVSLFTV